jgi:acetyl-CoA C-acetyltransferase
VLEFLHVTAERGLCDVQIGRRFRERPELGHLAKIPEFFELHSFTLLRSRVVRRLALADIDVIEANEAFAAQACAVAQQLGFDPAKVNPNGSGISLGHPVGATGAILVVKLLAELQRTGGRYGLATMCVGGLRTGRRCARRF